MSRSLHFGKSKKVTIVSRVFHKLEDVLEHYVYSFTDGTYFSVIYDEGCKMPILAVMGVRPDGQREVLVFSVGDRENQPAWEALLDELKTRGLKTVDLWITDGNRAMLTAVEAKFATARRQRCIKHKMENVSSYVPQQQREQVEPELKAIFYQENRTQAEQQYTAFCAKYAKVYKTAVECLERDIDACLTF